MIATNGRSSITHTVAALTPQLQHGDEILIERNDHGDWGHRARNQAIPRCAGTHIAFIDDDDQHTPDALATIRAHLEQEPDRVHLYAMRYTDGHELQPELPIHIGGISTQMFVVPNKPSLLGEFGDRYEGDYDFIHTTMDLRGDTPAVHPHVIAIKG